MRNHLTKAGRETCGMPDPKLDHFADVRRACHEKLMRCDPDYRRISESARERNRSHKEAR